MSSLKTLAIAPLVTLLLTGCSDKPRPTESELLPAEYANCRRDFSVCKGKFIKFVGVIVSIGGGSTGKVVRITTPMHGFDVEMIEKLEANFVGGKVLFSGYLVEDHTYNDDVSRGRIEFVFKRPTETEILPANYAKCRPSFSVCKGKFIKFEGVIVSIGEGSKGKVVRISTPMRGFDVEMIEKLEANFVGGKVLFSGYLVEDHTFNDDVSRGQIEAVLMNPTEVSAEKAETARQEAERCAEDVQCTYERVMTTAYTECGPLIQKQAKFDYEWTTGWTTPMFSRVRWSDPERKGIVLTGDQIKLQNGLGSWIRHSYQCEFDLSTATAKNVRIWAGRIP